MNDNLPSVEPSCPCAIANNSVRLAACSANRTSSLAEASPFRCPKMKSVALLSMLPNPAGQYAPPTRHIGSWPVMFNVTTSFAARRSGIQQRLRLGTKREGKPVHIDLDIIKGDDLVKADITFQHRPI